MLILMIIAAALFYAGLVRHTGKGTRSGGSSSPGTGQRVPRIPIREGPVAAPVEPLTWTALDDLQLDRFLRESS